MFTKPALRFFQEYLCRRESVDAGRLVPSRREAEAEPAGLGEMEQATDRVQDTRKEVSPERPVPGSSPPHTTAAVLHRWVAEGGPRAPIVYDGHMVLNIPYIDCTIYSV